MEGVIRGVVSLHWPRTNLITRAHLYRGIWHTLQQRGGSGFIKKNLITLYAIKTALSS